ncbi:MAG: hypothetical protein JXB07_14705 [Anaerolineae bacterium]|nr:hypothetical protein [Anaerolineae bacterium]
MSNQFKVGDSVAVKSGTVDPDNGQDVGGWQGRVVGFHTYKGEKLVTIQLDSITLENMPLEVIKQCEEAGTNWAELVLGVGDIQPAQARDTEEQVEEVEERISAHSFWFAIGPEGEAIRAVLEGIDPDDTVAAFEAWRDHLSASLTFPFVAEIDEWQDRGLFQPGDKLTVLNVEADILAPYGVMVGIRKKYGLFVFPLCDLAAADEESDNYDLIEEYQVWFANR